MPGFRPGYATRVVPRQLQYRLDERPVTAKTPAGRQPEMPVDTTGIGDLTGIH